LQGCFIIWAVLSIGAVIRLQGQAFYYFCPYVSYLADPWSRGRLGAGYDYLWIVAMHFHLLIAAMFGITLALIKSPKLRAVALFGVVTAWPYFIFGRTRNYMLAAVLPGVVAWVFLRLRIHFVLKVIVLAAIYSVISAWFSFVMVNRGDVGIASAFSEEGFNIQDKSRVHQEGLNMFEELCWINTFLTDGSWKPIWGQEYYAELANPIPRTWWQGKPMIGIDYAILRGQAYDSGGASVGVGSGAGVGATISSGMLGQGVVNYGQVLGPAFVAFLMSLWVAVLARLDLYGQGVGRLPLYSLGLILTFNLGRDITLLTLYTFVFGALLMWLVERSAGGGVSSARTVPQSQARGKAPVPSGISGGAPLDSSPSHRENPVPLSSSIGSPD
jgi:hypothetical protein